MGQGQAMLLGAIAFVSGKIILGIILMEAGHELIPVDLGDDRGGPDGKTPGIPVFDGPLGTGPVYTKWAIN